MMRINSHEIIVKNTSIISSFTIGYALQVQNALNTLGDLLLTFLRLFLQILMEHPMEIFVPRQYLEKQQPVFLRIEIQIEQDLLLTQLVIDLQLFLI